MLRNGSFLKESEETIKELKAGWGDICSKKLFFVPKEFYNWNDSLGKYESCRYNNKFGEIKNFFMTNKTMLYQCPKSEHYKKGCTSLNNNS